MIIPAWIIRINESGVNFKIEFLDLSHFGEVAYGNENDFDNLIQFRSDFWIKK
jgi:hypothetical protein